MQTHHADAIFAVAMCVRINITTYVLDLAELAVLSGGSTHKLA